MSSDKKPNTPLSNDHISRNPCKTQCRRESTVYNMPLPAQFPLPHSPTSQHKHRNVSLRYPAETIGNEHLRSFFFLVFIAHARAVIVGIHSDIITMTPNRKRTSEPASSPSTSLYRTIKTLEPYPQLLPIS
jgi:hypothetical protein